MKEYIQITIVFAILLMVIPSIVFLGEHKAAAENDSRFLPARSADLFKCICDPAHASVLLYSITSR